MDLKAYVSAIKAGWKIVLGALIITVAVAAAALTLSPSTPRYVSSTSLFVAAKAGTTENLNELYQRNAVAALRVTSYVPLAISDSVTSEVSDLVGFEVDSEAVQPVVVVGTVVIQVDVTDADAERARDIAAAYGEVLPRAVADIEQVRDSSEPQVEVRVIDAADLPDSPQPTTSVLRSLLAAALLGLGVGFGIAVLRYALAQDGTSTTPGVGTA